MGKRHRHSTGPLQELRLAIDCLPAPTRRAMLDGIRSGERVIAGAYVDGDGGACPMLLAHRHGAPTALLSFARSWDRFTGARRGAREIAPRELAILSRQLEASLQGEAATEMAGAIREHRALIALRDARCADPTGEIAARRLQRPRGYSSSPGRLNMTSGTTHAGEIFSR